MCYYCSLLSLVLHLTPIMRGEFLSQIEELIITKPIVGRDYLWQRYIPINAETVGLGGILQTPPRSNPNMA